MYEKQELDSKLLPELKEIARKLNIERLDKYHKQELIYKILDHQAINPSPETLEAEKARLQVVKRGRGRPPKSEPKKETPGPEKVREDNIPQKRGRKPKQRSEDTPSQTPKPSVHPHQPKNPEKPEKAQTNLPSSPPIHPMQALANAQQEIIKRKPVVVLASQKRQEKGPDEFLPEIGRASCRERV